MRLIIMWLLVAASAFVAFYGLFYAGTFQLYMIGLAILFGIWAAMAQQASIKR